jgi:hypothetical protein
MTPVRRPGRRRLRTVVGRSVPVGIALALALACAASHARVAAALDGGRASSQLLAAPPLPAAGATASDAGVMSFVANAQRGQVVPPGLGDVERMCALLTSCDKLPIPPSLIPDDFASCVKRMSDEMTSTTAVNFSLTMRECGLQAASCSGLRACALRGANAEACVGRGKIGVVGFCDIDGRALTCWHDQTLAVRDCPRGGEQCIVVDGQATCTLGPCAGGDTDKPRCSASGTHLLQCEKGKLASLDCTAFGLKCATAGDGTAGCSTGLAPCAAAASRCDGNASVGCFNGHEVRVDCAAAGLVCKAGAGPKVSVGACAATAPPGGACDPADKPSCDDGSIKYCAAGRPRAFSCAAFGLGRCAASKNGVRCAP